MRWTVRVSLLAACAALSTSPLLATVIPPIGLSPASQYQLIFVTASARDAVSVDIDDYNTFVSDEAFQGVPFGLPGGELASGSFQTEVGHFALDGTWLEFALAPQFGAVTFSKPMYALSDAITVNVPEPATLALLSIAILLGMGHQALRLRRKPALARVVKLPPRAGR